MDNLSFDNRFTRQLPADPNPTNSRRQVEKACYSRVQPAKVIQPTLIAYSKEVAYTLGLSQDFCESEAFSQAFVGNNLLQGMDPYACCYGGHQFGHWAGQLGDGRAINLGEIVNQQQQRWTLQLKGAGPTPYSRTADGLAVLRSSLREFLCSEAMFHLGVPTTRALSLISTGEEVIRDMMYDGNAKYEPGAVVCRVAPSFTRFGSFEIFTSRSDVATLEKLVGYTITTDFPHLGEVNSESIIKWFNEICQSTAHMVVEWMRVGFVHGVMNTDNMSILGLTIDYGPYGWIDDYDRNWTPNTTDASGRRYRFGQQSQIALWNLSRLASAIYPLINDEDPFHQAINLYISSYEKGWNTMMCQKLGLSSYEPSTDKELFENLLNTLECVETDMTLFFRALAKFPHTEEDSDEDLIAPLMEAYYQPEQLTGENKSHIAQWLRSYKTRLTSNSHHFEKRQNIMNATNPKYVLRNYIAQLAIDKAEKGDYALVNELVELFRHPYDEQPSKEEYAAKRPEWAKNRVGCSMLSCSS